MTNKIIARSYFNQAKNYRDAASRILPLENTRIHSDIPIFLLLTSLELYLKAFLIRQSYTKTKLKGLGHKLHALLTACKKESNADLAELLEKIDTITIRVQPDYKSRDLIYPNKIGYRHSKIDANDLDDCIIALSRKIKSVI